MEEKGKFSTIEKSNLITQYIIENVKKEDNIEYNEDLVNSLKEELINLDAFEEAEEKVKEIIEDGDKFQIAIDSCDRLKEILENFSIWKVGKFDKELSEIKENLNKYDKHYVARTFLYKDIMNISKFKDFKEEDKVSLAMQLGALDFSSLMKVCD